MLMYGKEAKTKKQEIDRQHALFQIKDQKTSIAGKSKLLDFLANADDYVIPNIH